MSKLITENGRVTYGFPLNFPNRFTIRSLIARKHGKVKGITLYKRIEAGINSGLLVVSGRAKPAGSGRGRPAYVYSRTDVKDILVSNRKHASGV